MAFINGPNTVKDNLIVCYDPQNPMSKVSSTIVDNTVSPQFRGTAAATFPDPSSYPKYLDFNGSNDVLNSATNLPASTGFSFNIWVKHNGAQSGGYDRIFGTSGFRFEIAETNTGLIRLYEGSWYTSTVTLDDAGWTNLAIINTVDPLMKIYKNGALQQTLTGGRSMTSQSWRLGGNGNNPATETWKGFIGYFSYYSKELTTPEVIQNYNVLKSRFI
tara:strand:- start:259 stop:909 length:651 start_codon:yes stop_codon:yes gene_type:complete